MQVKNIKWYIKVGGLLLAGIFIVLSLRYFHMNRFWIETKTFFLGNPLLILFISISYLLSFVLRAQAWKLYLGKSVRFISCLEGVLLSLFINHITPIKVGDAVRIGILSWKEKQITTETSTHSVIILRVLDMMILSAFSLIGLLVFSKDFLFRYSLWFVLFLISFALLVVYIVSKYFPSFFRNHIRLLKSGLCGKNSFIILVLITMSWILEGTVVWGVTATIGNGLQFYKAVWVNSMTVGGQVFQITPGGISTYESVMTATLFSFQYPLKDGFMVALISHSYKFIFSYIVGFLFIIQSPIKKMKQIKMLLLPEER